VPRRFQPPYPPEYRAEAVSLVRESGRRMRDVAQTPGGSGKSLGQWVKQDAVDSGRRKDGLSSEEREDLRRLRLEVRSRREDKEIPNKVVIAV